MTLTNWTKLVVAVCVILCCTALMITEHVTEAAGMGLIGTVVGYVLGNGIAARRNEPVEPILGPRLPPPAPHRDAGEIPPPLVILVGVLGVLFLVAFLALAGFLGLV